MEGREQPARYSATGNRERSFFATKQEAENYCVKRLDPPRISATGRRTLPPADHEQATNALELLKPYGILLPSCARPDRAKKAAKLHHLRGRDGCLHGLVQPSASYLSTSSDTQPARPPAWKDG